MTDMLLVCPSCRTRYVVPDTAIGIDGRQVRCANCKHSWFQAGHDVALPAAAPATTAEPFAPPDPPPPPVYTEAPPAPERSSFDHEPPFRPRRNPAKLRTIAAAGFAAVLLVLGGAIWYFGLLADSLPFASHEPDLKIVLDAQQDRQTLRDGTEYFAASGTIVNSGAAAQTIPPLLVVLRDASGRVVFQWKMAPPVRRLAPGGQVKFNEAKLDVPRAARQLEVGWAERGG